MNDRYGDYAVLEYGKWFVLNPRVIPGIVWDEQSVFEEELHRPISANGILDAESRVAVARRSVEAEYERLLAESKRK